MNYLSARDTLLNENYIPLPVIPNDKKPALRGWTDSKYTPPKGYGGYGVGVACGRGECPVAGVDIDDRGQGGFFWCAHLVLGEMGLATLATSSAEKRTTLPPMERNQ